ncbi:hypothetical protein U1Q18_027274, partial [Sarracenia purpurea var. burkii]
SCAPQRTPSAKRDQLTLIVSYIPGEANALSTDSGPERGRTSVAKRSLLLITHDSPSGSAIARDVHISPQFLNTKPRKHL